MTNMRYLSQTPRNPDAPSLQGRIIVHNHVRPLDFAPDFPLGVDGFRAWTEPEDTPGRAVCDCEWVPWMGEHYRVEPAGAR